MSAREDFHCWQLNCQQHQLSVDRNSDLMMLRLCHRYLYPALPLCDDVTSVSRAHTLWWTKSQSCAHSVMSREKWSKLISGRFTFPLNLTLPFTSFHCTGQSPNIPAVAQCQAAHCTSAHYTLLYRAMRLYLHSCSAIHYSTILTFPKWPQYLLHIVNWNVTVSASQCVMFTFLLICCVLSLSLKSGQHHHIFVETFLSKNVNTCSSYGPVDITIIDLIAYTITIYYVHPLSVKSSGGRIFIPRDFPNLACA